MDHLGLARPAKNFCRERNQCHRAGGKENMNPITLLQPPRIVFGTGCAEGCVELFQQRGFRRVLLVSGRSVRPQIDFLVNDLKRVNCEIVESESIPAEPTLNFFEGALRQAKAAKVEAVLGVGGGSVLDVAKLLAALVRGKQDVSEIFGVNLLHSRELFLVCLPTTAGTGSEVSPIAVLLDEAAALKKGVVSPHLVPDAAFIDPALTASVPANVTAATGLDALTHCIEAYANKFAHPLVDVYAAQGIRLISQNLLQAVRNGADVQARANMALGSFYGGLCLGPVNTAAVHALSYPLGGQFHVAHGVSNAVLLPHVLRFNLAAAPGRYAEIATMLGLERNGSTADTAESGIQNLITLSKACQVPQHLAELGVPRAAIPSMATAAMKVTRLLKNNLRPMTEEDAMRIYEAAY
jgi:alcohol dehydrogenase